MIFTRRHLNVSLSDNRDILCISMKFIDSFLTSSRVENRLEPSAFGHCLEKRHHRNLQVKDSVIET